MYYLRIWLAGARYSITRTLMFRGDFIIWSLVELCWMAVNLLLIAVIYAHTDSIAGWGPYQMTLLVATALLIQRLLMGFFWTNLFEMARNIRTGAFDFFLAQPGHPLFMASTRKLDPDGLLNSFVALAVVIFAVRHLHLAPTPLDVLLYLGLLVAGLAIHYSVLVLTMSLTFWLTSAQGIEGSYFTLAEFGRLPREALKGIARVVFVWILPVTIVSNVPTRALLGGFRPVWILWLLGAAALWVAVAIFVFNRGLRRYSSASS
jgi:ABC-2 type transport system permease protein